MGRVSNCGFILSQLHFLPSKAAIFCKRASVSLYNETITLLSNDKNLEKNLNFAMLRILCVRLYQHALPLNVSKTLTTQNDKGKTTDVYGDKWIDINYAGTDLEDLIVLSRMLSKAGYALFKSGNNKDGIELLLESIDIIETSIKAINDRDSLNNNTENKEIHNTNDNNNNNNNNNSNTEMKTKDPQSLKKDIRLDPKTENSGHDVQKNVTTQYWTELREILIPTILHLSEAKFDKEPDKTLEDIKAVSKVILGEVDIDAFHKGKISTDIPLLPPAQTWNKNLIDYEELMYVLSILDSCAVVLINEVDSILNRQIVERIGKFNDEPKTVNDKNDDFEQTESKNEFMKDANNTETYNIDEDIKGKLSIAIEYVTFGATLCEESEIKDDGFRRHFLLMLASILSRLGDSERAFAALEAIKQFKIRDEYVDDEPTLLIELRALLRSKNPSKSVNDILSDLIATCNLGSCIAAIVESLTYINRMREEHKNSIISIEVILQCLEDVMVKDSISQNMEALQDLWLAAISTFPKELSIKIAEEFIKYIEGFSENKTTGKMFRNSNSFVVTSDKALILIQIASKYAKILWNDYDINENDDGRENIPTPPQPKRNIIELKNQQCSESILSHKWLDIAIKLCISIMNFTDESAQTARSIICPLSRLRLRIHIKMLDITKKPDYTKRVCSVCGATLNSSTINANETTDFDNLAILTYDPTINTILNDAQLCLEREKVAKNNPSPATMYLYLLILSNVACKKSNNSEAVISVNDPVNVLCQEYPAEAAAISRTIGGIIGFKIMEKLVGSSGDAKRGMIMALYELINQEENENILAYKLLCKYMQTIADENLMILTEEDIKDKDPDNNEDIIKNISSVEKTNMNLKNLYMKIAYNSAHQSSLKAFSRHLLYSSELFYYSSKLGGGPSPLVLSGSALVEYLRGSLDGISSKEVNHILDLSVKILKIALNLVDNESAQLLVILSITEVYTLIKQPQQLGPFFNPSQICIYSPNSNLSSRTLCTIASVLTARGKLSEGLYAANLGVLRYRKDDRKSIRCIAECIRICVKNGGWNTLEGEYNVMGKIEACKMCINLVNSFGLGNDSYPFDEAKWVACHMWNEGARLYNMSIQNEDNDAVFDEADYTSNRLETDSTIGQENNNNYLGEKGINTKYTINTKSRAFEAINIALEIIKTLPDDPDIYNIKEQSKSIIE